MADQPQNRNEPRVNRALDMLSTSDVKSRAHLRKAIGETLEEKYPLIVLRRDDTRPALDREHKTQRYASEETSGVIIFNDAGIIIAVIGFAVAFGIGAIVGTSAEGPLMMIGGPLVAILDLVYRFKSANGHWFIPHRGGSLFFLPLWAFGVLWLILGIVYTVGGGG